MKRIGRLLFVSVFVIIVLLGLGYAIGVSGRGDVQRALDASRQQLDLAEARGHLLDARVSLYNNNFGDAMRRYEDAQQPMQRIRERFADAGNGEAARQVGAALERLEEARRLAGKLDPGANTKTGEALDALRMATSK